MIKPWLFEFFPELAESGDAADYFGRYLDLWARDEALDFEGIFFSEHHFGGSFSASPNLLIAAVAQRTRRLRLGVMGVVLPYYHPVRVVEEIGLLDHLTGGRLEIGTAVGVPQELARLGMTMEEARERSDEIVEVIDAALAQQVVSHQGKHYSFSNLRILPRTLQRPSPPRWTAVISAESARRAARRGVKISTGFNPRRRSGRSSTPTGRKRTQPIRTALPCVVGSPSRRRRARRGTTPPRCPGVSKASWRRIPG
jgi:alkanesulfonate monooxygenase SsuD/methylene tetrahydromethanopterin reductase-like flavin-dependent oxidoreductase (luciferase family)